MIGPSFIVVMTTCELKAECAIHTYKRFFLSTRPNTNETDVILAQWAETKSYFGLVSSLGYYVFQL